MSKLDLVDLSSYLSTTDIGVKGTILFARARKIFLSMCTTNAYYETAATLRRDIVPSISNVMRPRTKRKTILRQFVERNFKRIGYAIFIKSNLGGIRFCTGFLLIKNDNIYR